MNYIDYQDFIWEDSIITTDKLYPPKVNLSHSVNGKMVPTKYTIRELIEQEIYSARCTLKECLQDKKDLNKFQAKLKRIRQLNKIYRDDIEPMDFLEIFQSDLLEIHYENILYKLKDKEEALEKKIKSRKKNLKHQLFTIKRICLSNVTFLLKVDGQHKNYAVLASTLLSINNITIDNKNSLKQSEILDYKEFSSTYKDILENNKSYPTY